MRLAIVAVLSLASVPPLTFSAGESLSSQQRSRLDAYLEAVGSIGDIPRSFAKAIAVGAKGEPGIEFVALYTHEDPEGAGGNMWQQKMAIFYADEKGKPRIATRIVGGKSYRSVALRAVSPTAIEFDTKRYAEGDATCCPSLPAQTIYRVSFEERLILEEAPSTPNNSLERSRER